MRCAPLAARRALSCGSDARVEDAAGDAEQRVENEHGLERRQLVDAEPGNELGAGGGERAHRGSERADQAVAREDGRAARIRRRAGQQGMLERDEDAHASGRRIDGAGQRDDQDHGIGAGEGKQDAGCHHQARGRDQQMTLVEPRAHQADAERHEGRAQQREGCDHADLDGPEPDRSQIHRQQHGNEAVAEVAQRTRAIEVGGVAGRAVGGRGFTLVARRMEGGHAIARAGSARRSAEHGTRSLGWRLTGSSRTTPCAPYATRAAARQDSTDRRAMASRREDHWSATDQHACCQKGLTADGVP